MRELGRKGGRAIPKAKRKDAQRQSMRDYLRREVDPAAVWSAIQSSLASGNDRDRLAGAKLLLSELYQPGVDGEREREAERADARGRFMATIDQLAARRVQSTLVERGLIRPGSGPFSGVVRFDLRELADWAATWVPAPVTLTDVACATCGKAGVRLVAEGESVDGEAVCCGTCQPEANGRQ